MDESEGSLVVHRSTDAKGKVSFDIEKYYPNQKYVLMDGWIYDNFLTAKKAIEQFGLVLDKSKTKPDGTLVFEITK